jgi:cation:H+ antiporter
VDWFELSASLIVILAAAELFTNGVEWIGEGFGLSDGAVGSVLAAVGTALPETLLPIVAILLGHGSKATGKEIGTGAILGAPFMLSTLAMFVLAVAVLIFARDGRRTTELMGNRQVLLQDLGYFLAMYSLALVAGLFHHQWVHWVLAGVLMIGYGVYVWRHFSTPGEKAEEEEAEGSIAPLYAERLRARLSGRPAGAVADPSTTASLVQTLVALVGIIGGARLFVVGIDQLADTFHVPPLALALLLAPFATELPEKFNSVIWSRRGKDTLALGNLTGAMVFQSSFPVTVGLLLTPWKLTGDALVAAAVALVAGSVLWLTLLIRGRLTAHLLLAQGVFYAVFVAYVIARL